MASTQPVAALVPLTPEARTSAGTDRIALAVFPFRVGRESRFGLVQGHVVSMERRNTDATPTNDLYLLDHEQFLNISREHFQIEQNPDGSYALLDRGSTCGTIVDDTPLGAGTNATRRPLHDGSLIRVGRSASPFLFRFTVNHAAP